jgi:hypothetical protein
MVIQLARIAAIAAALVLGAAGAAGASTARITSGCEAASFCQGWELASPDLAMAVQGGTDAYNTPLIAATPAPTDPAQDFYVHRQPAGFGYFFEAAPNGVRSGFCVSQPNVHAKTAIVLRPCHANNRWQTFRKEDVGQGAFRMLVNRKSGKAIADPASGGNGTALLSRNPGFGTAQNELWSPVVAPPL